ncbi:MAG TPA: ABC transporter permease [Candidatus Polarisedimenticolaceae bacterium]|nr:ABC transporter permease [Candidatus Polarisedimenticolaceae bacterium]
MNGLLHDLRFALRLLYKQPAFAVFAVVTLALGIGAATTIFSVTEAVLLRPLPFPEPGRLVWIWGRWEQSSRASVSAPDFRDYREQARSFERFAAATSFVDAFNLTGSGSPELIPGALVSAEFFDTLGVRPKLGRGFAPDDEHAKEPQVALVGHALWQRRFGGDPALVGRALTINGQSVTVVGVMAPDFEYPSGAQLWLPLPLDAPGFQLRRAHFLRPVARLAPGVSLEAAQAEVDTIARGLEQRYPDSNHGWGMLLVPLAEPLVGNVRLPLAVLLAAVAAVLLIGCANLANLLLARAAVRRKELAIRAALGAGRVRLVRQLLTESLLVSLTGGVAGVLLAVWGIDLLRGLGAALPRVEQAALHGPVLAFALAISLATGVIFGLAPALHAAHVEAHPGLQEGGRGSRGTLRGRLRAALVVTEVALSVLLLAGAGLLVRSLDRLTAVRPGFDPHDVLTTRLTLPEAKYPEQEQRSAFFAALLERLGGLPGVTVAAGVSELPLAGQNNDTYFAIEGRPPLEAGQKLDANVRRVTPGYFRAMGIGQLRGRGFGAQDRLGSPGAVIINEPMAERFFPDEDPLGQRLTIDLGQPFSAEIVGVVAGIRHHALQWEPAPEMYLCYGQLPGSRLNLVVRSDREATGLAGAVRAAVAELDRDQPLGEFVSMQQRIDRALAAPRLRTTLLGAFAGLALLLAAIGMYGVLSYTVSLRTHEIGVRMALGASAGDVRRLIVGQGMRLAALGLALGLGGALVAGRLMASLLFGVGAGDPVTFVLAPLALAAVALAACWLPARRAARVEPLEVLRCE